VLTAPAPVMAQGSARTALHYADDDDRRAVEAAARLLTATTGRSPARPITGGRAHTRAAPAERLVDDACFS